jgi:hypothetical protein
MWAQRILTQFSPLFAAYYERTKSTQNDEHQQAVIGLITELLQLIKRIPVPLATEMELLFPIIVEAHSNSKATDDHALLLTEATIQLIQLSSAITADKLNQIAYSMERYLSAEDCPPKIAYASLEVLEVLVKHVPSKKQLTRLPQTLAAIHRASKSKKRAIRLKSAIVRNVWEMIKV